MFDNCSDSSSETIGISSEYLTVLLKSKIFPNGFERSCGSGFNLGESEFPLKSPTPTI